MGGYWFFCVIVMGCWFFFGDWGYGGGKRVGLWWVGKI